MVLRRRVLGDHQRRGFRLLAGRQEFGFGPLYPVGRIDSTVFEEREDVRCSGKR
jgi:hypothetical protein